MNWKDHIVSNDEVLLGKPVLKALCKFVSVKLDC